jgi:hypothetical protein
MTATIQSPHNSAGFVLVMAVLILTALLLSGSYLISVANADQKISTAQFVATKNYYLAESGINDMIWKIQNDSAAQTAFLNGTLDNAYDINRTSVFGDTKANYQVTALSTATGEAELIATSTYAIANSQSQRVVRAYLVKAIGSGQQWDFSTFAGGRGTEQNGNFRFNGSGVVFTSNGGRVHANQELKIQGAEVTINDGAITSGNVINVVAGGILTLNNSYQDAPTSTIEMLQIDFDSDLATSWKNRADLTYTENEFKDLAGGTVLDGIIFVTGDAEINGKDFTINGVLVAEGEIKVTSAGQTITVTADPVIGGGLLSKEDIDFTTSGGTVTVDGLIYAGDDLDITSAGTNFTVNGSMAGFDAEITASGGSVIVNYIPENFEPVINASVNQDSPLIQIDHWEEQY